MRPVRGQTALLRALRDDLAPMFGTVPFTVAVWPDPRIGRGDMRLVTVQWPHWRYWLPVLCSMMADVRMRRWVIGRIGLELWRQHLPRQRRMQRRAAG